jgi:hypothetical protein
MTSTTSNLLKLDAYDVIIRKELQEEQTSSLLNYFEQFGINFVTHTLITHYRETGHTISSFCTNPEWQDYYWPVCSNNDKAERLGHSQGLKGESFFVHWKAFSSTDALTKERLERNGCYKGITLFLPQKDGTLENLSLGWGHVKKDDNGIEPLSNFRLILQGLNTLRAKHQGLFWNKEPIEPASIPLEQ